MGVLSACPAPKQGAALSAQHRCAGAEHHEAAGCWHKDLRMVHMEEGTERNLHSGHMVYMTALREVGVGTGH